MRDVADTAPPDQAPYAVAEAVFADAKAYLSSREAQQMSESELERELDRRGQELIRRLLQGHRRAPVEGVDDVERDSGRRRRLPPTPTGWDDRTSWRPAVKVRYGTFSDPMTVAALPTEHRRLKVQAAPAALPTTPSTGQVALAVPLAEAPWAVDEEEPHPTEHRRLKV